MHRLYLKMFLFILIYFEKLKKISDTFEKYISSHRRCNEDCKPTKHETEDTDERDLVFCDKLENSEHLQGINNVQITNGIFFVLLDVQPSCKILGKRYNFILFHSKSTIFFWICSLRAQQYL